MGLAAWPLIAVNPGNGEQARPVDLAHQVITVQLQLSAARFCIEPLVGAN